MKKTDNDSYKSIRKPLPSKPGRFLTTKKGKKGYDRKVSKKIIKETTE